MNKPNSIRPNLEKTILTGMCLGKAFLINMGTFFNVGSDYFWIDWHNNLLYHGKGKYELQRNKEKQTGYFALVFVSYNLDGLQMFITDRQGKDVERVVKWENLNIQD